MFMAFMSILITFSAPLLGGNLAHLAAVRLRYSGIIIAALAVQILITAAFSSAPRVVLVVLHLATYAAAAVVLWVNRQLPGLIIIGIGAMTNATVIALNGGTLPASAHALAAAGWRVKDSTFTNSSVVVHPVLPWLGDIMATPAWLPFRNVISIGDFIVLLGAFVLIHRVSRSRLSLFCARLMKPSRTDQRFVPSHRR